VDNLFFLVGPAPLDTPQAVIRSGANYSKNLRADVHIFTQCYRLLGVETCVCSSVVVLELEKLDCAMPGDTTNTHTKERERETQQMRFNSEQMGDLVI
jgi:hypothetical protein